MNNDLIFGPVLAQITLTIIIFLLLGAAKIKAIKTEKVDREKTALHNDAWPDPVLKISNNIANQFQTPILFYVLCLVLWNLKAVNPLVVGLAWGYVVSRVVHAYIHIGSNYVPMRFRMFTLGTLILIVMLVLAVVALFSA